LAADLVRLRVDVLVTGGTAGVRAAKQATTTIPIVMTASGDAVSSGLIASLARPGGNVTGSTFFVPELMAKRLELLKEAMPRTGRVAVLVNADDPSHVPVVKAMASTARSLKIEIQKFEVRRPSEFESAFTAITKNRMDAVVVQEDALLTANAQVIE
jgi:putative ABC transport system substrate-binding protein